MSPLETAFWWTEYVLRQNETSHIKFSGMYKPWWQRRLLDFWLISLALIIIVFCIGRYVVLYAVGMLKAFVRFNAPKIKRT